MLLVKEYLGVFRETILGCWFSTFCNSVGVGIVKCELANLKLGLKQSVSELCFRVVRISWLESDYESG